MNDIKQIFMLANPEPATVQTEAGRNERGRRLMLFYAELHAVMNRPPIAWDSVKVRMARDNCREKYNQKPTT